tara:strand:- start:219 stop:1175 length:957 start_codon:yes stop_codon:yes gene_type:complete
MGLDKQKKLLSIVVPCFNEEEVISETFTRLFKFSNQLKELNVEIIFVDDGSSDSTSNYLKDFVDNYPFVKAVFLARNFGHQIAVTAGIDYSEGDAVVIIDADLQDPPEVIAEMIDKWEEGYDVVYGKRIVRKGESFFKKLTAKGFYRILNLLSDVYIPLDTGDFRLISRDVVNSLRKMPEKDRFLRGMISWVGFKQYALPYKRSERFAGKSKYPLQKMLKFAADGILSFSTKPLQISITLGSISAFIALLGIFYALFLRIFTKIWVEGWTGIMISILFIGGVQLICIGILGNYIGRIYNETKNRPLYFVRQYRGFEKD